MGGLGGGGDVGRSGGGADVFCCDPEPGLGTVIPMTSGPSLLRRGSLVHVFYDVKTAIEIRHSKDIPLDSFGA